MYKLKTYSTKILADTITPVSVYLKVRDRFPNSILLESSDYRANDNTFSYICCNPIASINIQNEEIIKQLNDGHIDAALAATPLDDDNLIETPLYYEPFVAYIPTNHRLADHNEIAVSDLDLEDILLLEDGHCFRDGVINLCNMSRQQSNKKFKLESGSFETLIKLSDEGLGMTLLPYLHTKQIKCDEKPLRHFKDPKPAREVSLLYKKSKLKIQITTALKETIEAVVRGAIAFHDVKIISPQKR